MKTRVQAHVCYRVQYHIVWIPKYRYKVLGGGVGKYCDKVIRTVVIKEYPDVVIKQLKVMEDHVHLVVVIPPKYAISQVVGKMKGTSSRLLRRKFDHQRNTQKALWSIGYFVSTIGIDEEKIKKYIEHQEKQDKGQLLL